MALRWLSGFKCCLLPWLLARVQVLHSVRSHLTSAWKCFCLLSIALSSIVRLLWSVFPFERKILLTTSPFCQHLLWFIHMPLAFLPPSIYTVATLWDTPAVVLQNRLDWHCTTDALHNKMRITLRLFYGAIWSKSALLSSPYQQCRFCHFFYCLVHCCEIPDEEQTSLWGTGDMKDSGSLSSPLDTAHRHGRKEIAFINSVKLHEPPIIKTADIWNADNLPTHFSPELFGRTLGTGLFHAWHSTRAICPNNHADQSPLTWDSHPPHAPFKDFGSPRGMLCAAAT